VQSVVGILLSLILATSIGGNVSTNVYGSSQLSNGIANQQKVVILTFDDGYGSQYSNAKPILDKYGFKATFYIVCNYVGSGDNRMTWKDIKSLQQEGHDIASHTMNHDDLSKLPPQKVEYEVAQSKQCLLDQGINPKSFAYPFNGGSDDPSVINTVASYYSLARTATDPLAFLGCDDSHSNSECDTYKYAIMGWSHDSERKSDAYNDQQMFERFVHVVNSQNEYNSDGVNAVPILIWHKIDNSNEEYSTSTNLFGAEMKYLHDNGFTVLTMADLVYDDSSNYLRISDNKGGAHEPIPNNQNKFAVRVTDPEEENDNLSTIGEEDLINEVLEEEDIAFEENPPAIKSDDDNTISENSSRSVEDNEVDEVIESQIPSGIVRLILEP
jgi:peptidoglycan/xylan/chitin deacetylase (PgdA/CDA1 family)